MNDAYDPDDTDLPETPVFTPTELANATVEELLDWVDEHEDRVPRSLFEACVSRGDEMVSALAAYYDDMERAFDDPDIEFRWASWWMFIHGMFILGAIPGEEAGKVLMEAMRSTSFREDIDILDWVIGRSPYLFANKPASVIQLARDAAEDAEEDPYVRSEAVDIVLAHAMAQGKDALEDALDWLAGLVQKPGDPFETYDFRCMAADSLLDFPRTRHRVLLEQIAAEQEDEDNYLYFSTDDIEEAFAADEDQPEWLNMDDPFRFYDEDEIRARQERWRQEDELDEDEIEDDLEGRWRQEDELEDEIEKDEDRFRQGELFPEEDIHASEVYVRKYPKVGRNDPCPCGSGKKYKKCCLARDEAEEAERRRNF